MINPRAKRTAFLRLMLLLAIFCAFSAELTIALIIPVYLLSDLIWRQTQPTIGVDTRLFTILVCTLSGLLVGLLVKIFDDRNGIFAEIMLEFGKAGSFDFRDAIWIVLAVFMSFVDSDSLGPDGVYGLASGDLCWGAANAVYE